MTARSDSPHAGSAQDCQNDEWGQASTVIARDDTERRVTEILVGHLGLALEPERVQPDTLIVPEGDEHGARIDSGKPDLGADSLDVVELVMAIEDEFRIEIPDDAAEALNEATVAKLIDVVHAYRLESAQ